MTPAFVRQDSRAVSTCCPCAFNDAGQVTPKARLLHSLLTYMPPKSKSTGSASQKHVSRFFWHRSNTEISFMCDAIVKGVGQLESILHSQANKLEAVIGYCHALQQDQQILVQGQDVLIRGQRVVLQEILDLHQSVLVGTDTLAKVRVRHHDRA